MRVGARARDPREGVPVKGAPPRVGPPSVHDRMSPAEERALGGAVLALLVLLGLLCVVKACYDAPPPAATTSQVRP